MARDALERRRATHPRCGGPLTTHDRAVVAAFAHFLTVVPAPGTHLADLPPWRRYTIRLAAWRVEHA